MQTLGCSFSLDRTNKDQVPLHLAICYLFYLSRYVSLYPTLISFLRSFIEGVVMVFNSLPSYFPTLISSIDPFYCSPSEIISCNLSRTLFTNSSLLIFITCSDHLKSTLPHLFSHLQFIYHSVTSLP